MSSPLAAHRGLPKLPIRPRPADRVAMRPAARRAGPPASDRGQSKFDSRKSAFQPQPPGRQRRGAVSGAPVQKPNH